MHNKFQMVSSFRLLFLIILCLGIKVSGQKNMLISYTANPPQIDGIFSAGEWDNIQPDSGFIQMEPDKGCDASEITKVYASFDSINIYVAFSCIQGSSNPIMANIQTRDRVTGGDDAVILLLDTYIDSRTAYGFTVNPLGTQTDYKITDDGRFINYEWDTEWEAAAGRLATGWVCEMAIPFGSIKYRASNEIWGINFGRILISNLETSWWSGEMVDNFRISQGGQLEGIRAPVRPKRLMLFPYVSLRYENSDITRQYNKLKPDVGGDILVNLSSNFSMNATINPDFASVEGDLVKIDLTGWEVDFPDKRLFFQEGNEMFTMRYRPFYSRRIGDINYGVKFTGKAGGYGMNILNVRSPENVEQGLPAAFYTVARVKKDILRSSTIGAIIVDKSDFDTTFARSFGLDWVLNPGERWKITGQLMGSYPGDILKHSGGFLRVAHESNKHHVHLRYTLLGGDLAENINQTGFLRDDNRHELDADMSYTFWFNESFMRYIRVFFGNNVFWGLDGIMRGYTFRDYIRFYLTCNFSYRFYIDYRYQVRNSTDASGQPEELYFYNYFIENELGYNTDASSYASLSFSTGRNFNRKMKIIQGDVALQALERLTVKYNISWLNFGTDTLSYPGIRLEQNTLLNILTLDYYFTNNLWVRLFAQHNSYDKRFYLYGQFGWRFKPPFGALYLIYAGDNYFDHTEKQYYDHRTVFLKLTYPIGF
ncbi:MAG: hypothetical protein AMS26_00340 [Bacteroides sp. SM23_62]|nr:MAG: hypothetical protein AMS26_00340 [Bacteroides sp. SM23_62]